MAYPVYENSGNLTTSITVTIGIEYPSSISADDILIIVAAKDGSYGSGNATAPSGFTFLQGSDGSGDDFQTVIYWKRASGSESGSENLVWDNTPSSVTAGIMYRYSGCITTGDPYYDVNSSLSLGVLLSNATIPAVNSGGYQRIVMSYVIVKRYTTIATASDYTHATYDYTTVGVDITIKSQYQQVPTASSVPSDASSLGTGSYYASHALSLQPAIINWLHNFLGIDNANIEEISGEPLTNIQSVSSIE